MTENQIKVRNIIRGIVDNKLSSIVETQISGSDFVGEVQDKLPLDDFTDVYSHNYDSPSIHLDKELYEKFVDHLTDLSMMKLRVI